MLIYQILLGGCLDMMMFPNKYNVIFQKEVVPWIEKQTQADNKKWHFQFRADTPKDIIDLFNKIKSHISYCA